MNDQPATVQEALVPPPAPSAPLPDDLLATMRLPAMEIPPSDSSAGVVPAPSVPSAPAVARKPWRLVASRVARGVVATASRIRAASRIRVARRWSITRTHVSIACGLSGAGLVVTSIVLGWSSVSGQGLERYGSAAAAIVVARAAIAIATMLTGASLLRMGERLAFAGTMLGIAPPRPVVVPRATAPR